MTALTPFSLELFHSLLPCSFWRKATAATRRRIEEAERDARRARIAAVTMAERARELLDGKEFFEVGLGFVFCSSTRTQVLAG